MTIESIDVVVEIPAGTRNKYEHDHELNLLRLVRQLPASVSYPADYGYIPGTLAEDGDPLDALLLIDEPTIPGCVVSARPLGVLFMSDEQGRDPKIISTFVRSGEDPHDLADVPARTLEEIEHFFSIYKDLEPGKRVETRGYAGRIEAEEEIMAARERASSSGSGRSAHRPFLAS